MTEAKSTSLKYKLISATLACFLYGSWAYYINTPIINFSSFESVFEHTDGVNSAIAQGVSSFIATLFIVLVVTFLYQRITFHEVLRIVVSSVITALGVGMSLGFIHWAIGTEHLIITILPSVIVATIFCFTTATKLSRMNAVQTTD